MKPEPSRTEDHILHAHGRISDLENRIEAMNRTIHKLSTALDSLLIATHLPKKPAKTKKMVYTQKS